MTYQPTADDFKDIPDELPKQSGYQPTAADFQQLDEEDAKRALKQSMMSPSAIKTHDFASGIVNPWIHMANKIPHVNINAMRPYNPTSLATRGGQFTGVAAPFALAETGIPEVLGLGARGAEAIGGLGSKVSPYLEKASQYFRSPTVARSALAGGLSGAATSPDNRSGVEGLEDAGIAGMTHGMGNLAGRALRTIPRSAKIQKAVSLFTPPITGDAETAATNASQKIANNYINQKQNVRSLYNEALKGADESGDYFSPEDFSAFKDTYNNYSRPELLPSGANKYDIDKIFNKDMSKNINQDQRLEMFKKGKLKLGADQDKIMIKPSEVQRWKTELNRRGYKTDIPNDAEAYKKLASSLNEDMAMKLNKISPALGSKYYQANQMFKKNILPFYKHQAFKKMADAIEEAPPTQLSNANDMGEQENLARLNWHGKKASSLKNSLVPTTTEDTGTEQLESMKNDLMGGNHEEARKTARDLMFSKYSKPLNGPPTEKEIETPHYKFNMYNFLNHYGNLKSPQKNWLFDSDEQKVLDNLHRYRNKLKDKSIANLAKRAMGGILGLISTAHTGNNIVGNLIKTGAATGGAALAIPAERTFQSVAKMAMKNDINKLLGELNAPYRSSSRPAAMGMGAANIYNNSGDQ